MAGFWRWRHSLGRAGRPPSEPLTEGDGDLEYVAKRF